MKKEVKILALIAGVVIIGAVIGASYYRSAVQNQPVTAPRGSSEKPAIPPEVLVRADSPTLGAADAPVTIVEFVDPECESCAAFAPVIKKVMAQFEGKTRLVIRYMPLHPNSLRAATLTEAAGEQGKYWQMQEYLFRKQPEWGERHGPPTGAPPPDVPALFDRYAREMGLDVEKVNAAYKENRFQEKVERDKRDGQSLGVRQTPTIFVNGRKLLRLNENDLKALIQDELKK